MIAVSIGDKVVTSPLLDNSLFAKIFRVCDPFFLYVTAKLEHTFPDVVLQCPSSLYFIPELFTFARNRYFMPKFDLVPLSAFGG